jgi:hypothetical protein
VPGLETSLWICAGLWLLGLVHLILNRLLAGSIEAAGAPEPSPWPAVSIVVPARDEEAGIAEAVASFCSQDYPRLEVIVVDDGSTDATPGILAELGERFSNLRVVRGEEPPPGWLGKVNALERGRREANGDWIIFSDADIVYERSLVRHAVSYAAAEDAGMLFLMPRLLVGGAIEAAVMSTLPLAFAILPVYLITKTRLKWFAAGSGVFNMAKREALDACGAFECLKEAVVDDVGLGYKIKAAGYKIAFAFALDSLRVRMYAGARETIAGFTKNCYPGLRVVPASIPVILALGFFVSFLPYFGAAAAIGGAIAPAPAAAALLAMHAVFAAIAALFRLPWGIVFLNPVREGIWWWILARSFLSYHFGGGVLWRGRRFKDPNG